MFVNEKCRRSNEKHVFILSVIREMHAALHLFIFMNSIPQQGWIQDENELLCRIKHFIGKNIGIMIIGSANLLKQMYLNPFSAREDFNLSLCCILLHIVLCLKH